jgi:outer membrane protein
MLKKIVLLAFVLIPALAFSQESQKMAFIKYAEIVPLMPEFAQMQDSLNKQAQAYEAELKNMQAEYEKKVTAFREEEEKLIGSIKERRLQEIENIRDRSQTLLQTAQQEQGILQEKLMTPIQEKLKKIVEEIADENHISCVLSEEVFIFHSSQIIDATPLVKAKLGLK